MEKVLIHIGLHKTGTTWLQNELFIPESNVFEPLYQSNTSNGHSTLAENFVFDNDMNLLSPYDYNTEIIEKAFQSILKKKDNINKTFVMSHERLSGHPTSSGFDSAIIANRIKNTFPSGKILVVLREQVSCILSNYFQYLKEGGTLGLKNFLNTKYDGRKPGFCSNYFKYHYLISYYQKTFGENNVLVLPYELLSTNKAKFIDILSGFLDEKIISETIKFNKKYNVNKNYYVEYKFRFLNNYIKSSSSLNNSTKLKIYRLKRIAKKTKLILNYITPARFNVTTKRKLEKEIQKWSVGRFEESNKISNTLVNIDLEEFGYLTVKKK
ncbi:hypothetical protein A9Q86_09470 [Flavobacteriales bacterium 33_180_T64]|nr:hypothetical protein A9Q86_09470 [Flavobacteriales bacterium 33_180_T64]